jgi:hypothetical protein
LKYFLIGCAFNMILRGVSPFLFYFKSYFGQV